MIIIKSLLFDMTIYGNQQLWWWWWWVLSVECWDELKASKEITIHSTIQHYLWCYFSLQSSASSLIKVKMKFYSSPTKRIKNGKKLWIIIKKKSTNRHRWHLWILLSSFIQLWFFNGHKNKFNWHHRREEEEEGMRIFIIKFHPRWWRNVDFEFKKWRRIRCEYEIFSSLFYTFHMTTSLIILFTQYSYNFLIIWII